MKLNCWQYKLCGREPGGKHVNEYGVCPAATESRLNGVHGGINGGRACWVVPGTISGGNLKNNDDYLIQKYRQCSNCGFYKRVRFEEGRNFLLTPELLKIIQNF